MAGGGGGGMGEGMVGNASNVSCSFGSEVLYMNFCLRLYGIGYMVKDYSDSERGNPLAPHGLLFLISSKGSFICTIPQTG